MRNKVTLAIAALVGFLRMVHSNEVGAIVTTDLLAGLLTGYRAVWKQALDDYAKKINQYLEISTLFPSTTDKESYGWMGAPPSMELWSDVRKYKAIAAYDYTLTNKHYEGTIEVDRDTIEDDKYGMIKPRIMGLARRALKHFNEMAFSALDDGASNNAYDGTAFFATGRKIGASADIDNILTGAYSGGASEIRDALDAAVAAMALFEDEWGKPIGLVPDTIVCAPAMQIPILNALLPSVIGAARPEAGIFAVNRIFATPWVDDDTADWYILCTDVEVRPIIFQMRKQPEFVAMDDPKSSHVFKNKTFLYGVDDRFAVGYGDPRTAIKIVDSP